MRRSPRLLVKMFEKFERSLAKESKFNEAGAKEPAEYRSLKIAIIGPPNVGKSALTNQIIKTDLCAVSKLIDTTRRVDSLIF